MAAIDRLFDELLAAKGSDLHLSVGYPPLIRSKGELIALKHPPLDEAQINRLLNEIIDEKRWNRFLEQWDLDFAYAYGDKARFRANYLYKFTGPGAVFRTIPSKILTAEDLKLPSACLSLTELRSGLVLVTGPTGSGKSTTLAAMLDHINTTRTGHILTIEDPIEFVHKPKQCLISHKEVGLDTPTFKDAIRSAGRENADIILVGELRGAETMRLALQLASFGVLIFATVHTNSAASTIERFVNAFPADEQQQIRAMLADCLGGIVAQQLLKTADGKGRVAAHEILIGNTAVSSTIREAKISMLGNLMQSGTSQGMQTMDSCLHKMVQQNQITPRDALEKANNKELFSRLPEIVQGVTEI